MIFRLMLGIVYLGTALLLGDWTLRTEATYEAMSQPLPTLLYPMAAALLLFAGATMITLFRPRFGIRTALLGCVLAAPPSAIAVIRTGWHFTLNNTYGQLSQEGTGVMLVIAATMSIVALRRTDDTSKHP
jgi:hypothetical protein